MYLVFPVSTEGPTVFTGIYEATCMFTTNPFCALAAVPGH